MITREQLYELVHDKHILDDAHTTFIVLDSDLHILYVNYTPVEMDLRISPGDLLKCSNARQAPKGCGTHENCKVCRLRNMVETSMQTKQKMEADADLLIGDNTDFSVHAYSTPFEHNGKVGSVVLFVDKTDQHREFLMERVFFHDLLNLSGALNGILGCMEKTSDTKEMMGIVRNISSQLLSEIEAQRDLIYARNGILKPKPCEFKASECVDFVHDSLTPIAHMYNVTIDTDSTLTDERLMSDKALVNRVLHNMLKNACEANPGSTVRFKARGLNGKIVFSVHNDAVMTDTVKSRVFIYGNSTKGAGRGLGTYGMKLIGENVLKGRVWFTSKEGAGTEFFFELNQAEQA